MSKKIKNNITNFSSVEKILYSENQINHRLQIQIINRFLLLKYLYFDTFEKVLKEEILEQIIALIAVIEVVLPVWINENVFGENANYDALNTELEGILNQIQPPENKEQKVIWKIFQEIKPEIIIDNIFYIIAIFFHVSIEKETINLIKLKTNQINVANHNLDAPQISFLKRHIELVQNITYLSDYKNSPNHHNKFISNLGSIFKHSKVYQEHYIQIHDAILSSKSDCISDRVENSIANHEKYLNSTKWHQCVIEAIEKCYKVIKDEEGVEEKFVIIEGKIEQLHKIILYHIESTHKQKSLVKPEKIIEALTDKSLSLKFDDSLSINLKYKEILDREFLEKDLPKELVIKKIYISDANDVDEIVKLKPDSFIRKYFEKIDKDGKHINSIDDTNFIFADVIDPSKIILNMEDISSDENHAKNILQFIFKYLNLKLKQNFNFILLHGSISGVSTLINEYLKWDKKTHKKLDSEYIQNWWAPENYSKLLEKDRNATIKFAQSLNNSLNLGLDIEEQYINWDEIQFEDKLNFVNIINLTSKSKTELMKDVYQSNNKINIKKLKKSKISEEFSNYIQENNKS